jgi:hypothetical protein
MKNGIFYLGLGMLFTHELDAMTNHEWRVLPILRALSDDLGANIFVLAHVPIFAIVIACVASLNPKVRAKTRLIASGILAIHSVLHGFFSGHAAYEFSSPASMFFIYGAASLGLLYLLADFLERRAISV